MDLDQRDMRQMLETAIVAARLAGQHAVEKMDFAKVSLKGENDIVTQVDTECQKIIIDRIKEMYPDHGFIGEEGSEGNIFNQPPRTKPAIYWVIDPIDGTNNYVHKMNLFTVSIAAIVDAEPILGVIFEPATESMYSALKGQDAQLNGRKISVSEEKIDKLSHVGIDTYLGSQIPQWAVYILTHTKYRNLGTTALHLSYVASGGLIATIVTTPKLWDIAAGAVIVQAAGGIVSDWQGEPIFPVDLENYHGEAIKFLAANKKVHAEIVKLLNS